MPGVVFTHTSTNSQEIQYTVLSSQIKKWLVAHKVCLFHIFWYMVLITQSKYLLSRPWIYQSWYSKFHVNNSIKIQYNTFGTCPAESCEFSQEHFLPANTVSFGAPFVDPLYLVFLILSCMFIAALWSHAGKGLAPRLSCGWCFLCLCHFPMWWPESGVVHDYITFLIFAFLLTLIMKRDKGSY